MSTVASEGGEGIRHLLGILRRWWILLATGTGLALAVAGFAVVGSPDRWVAQGDVLIDQPGLSRLPEGKEVVEKVAALLPTFGQLAVSDDVLEEVRTDLDLRDSINTLRGDLRAVTIADTLILRISAEREDEAEAEAIVGAVLEGLEERIAQLDEAAAEVAIAEVDDPGRSQEVIDASSIELVVLQAPSARHVTQDPARTFLIALVLGLGFSAVAAFVLDRS